MLLDHPAIGGELSETFVFGLTPERSWPAVFEQLSMQANNPAWLLEKTPLHIFNASRLLEIFPSARCLCLIRDGKEVVASMVLRSYSVKTATQRWVSSAQETLLLRSLYPSRSILVRYEDLVSSQIESLTRIAGFLGIRSAPLLKAASSTANTSYLGHNIDSFMVRSRYPSHNLVDFDLPHDMRRATQAALPLEQAGAPRWKEIEHSQRQYVLSNDDFVLYSKIFGYLPWSQNLHGLGPSSH